MDVAIDAEVPVNLVLNILVPTLQHHNLQQALRTLLVYRLRVLDVDQPHTILVVQLTLLIPQLLFVYILQRLYRHTLRLRLTYGFA